MEKNFLQDVTPPSQKRSIRNIPIPSHRKRRGPAYIEETPQQDKDDMSLSINDSYEEDLEEKNEYHSNKDDVQYHQTNPEIKNPYSYNNSGEEVEFNDEEDKYTYPEENPINNYRKNSHSKVIKLSIVGLVGVFVILFILLSTLFNKGEVSITTKSAEANVDSIFSLVEKGENIPINEEGSEISSEILEFTPIQISKEFTVSVPASGKETVEEKASGTITIFNNHSEDPYDLVKNTRFQSPDGLIYRIDKSIKVPGKTGDNPGTIEVTVYADEAGENYNILAPTDFTVPGLQGLPQFENIYAKTKGSINGGYKGEQAKITEEDKENALTKLEQDLTNEIINSINTEVPKNFIALYNPGMFTFVSSQIKNDSSSEATLKVVGTLNAYTISNLSLSQKLASKVLNEDSSENEGVLILNPDSLDITLNNDESVSIKGIAQFGWPLDENEIRSMIAGTKKSEIENTLIEQKGIVKIESSVRPFWKSKFPNNEDKINVSINN